MDDSELDELRKKRLSQLQNQQAQEQMATARDEQAQAELEARKQTILRGILTPEARERLNTLKLTKSELVAQVELQLIALAQSGRVQSKITDEQLKALLLQLQPKKRNIRITRK
ncbi:MAG: DNA-binding protein [Methermicoccaceae archaeon]